MGKTLVAIVNLPPPEDDGPGELRYADLRRPQEKGEEKLHLLMVDDAIPAGAKLC